MGEIIIDKGFVDTRFDINSDGTFSVTRTQDVAPILDNNKAAQIDDAANYTPSRDMKHVASIPLIVLEQWAKKWGIAMTEIFGPKMHEVIRKELNDPDNLFLRTGKGKI